MFGLPFEIVQMAWIVSDLDEAMAKWRQTGRVGPFFVMRNVAANAPVEVTVNGMVIDADASFALAQAGSVQIELIQRLGSRADLGPVAAATRAMDHVAIWADDIEATLDAYAAQGFASPVRGKFGPAGTRFAYVDACHTIGCLIEVIERTRPHMALFDLVAMAAHDWDGSDPIREIRTVVPISGDRAAVDGGRRRD